MTIGRPQPSTPAWAKLPWWTALALAAAAPWARLRKPPAEVPAQWQPDAPWHEAAPNDGH